MCFLSLGGYYNAPQVRSSLRSPDTKPVPQPSVPTAAHVALIPIHDEMHHIYSAHTINSGRVREPSA